MNTERSGTPPLSWEAQVGKMPFKASTVKGRWCEAPEGFLNEMTKQSFICICIIR